MHDHGLLQPSALFLHHLFLDSPCPSGVEGQPHVPGKIWKGLAHVLSKGPLEDHSRRLLGAEFYDQRDAEECGIRASLVRDYDVTFRFDRTAANLVLHVRDIADKVDARRRLRVQSDDAIADADLKIHAFAAIDHR